MCKAALRAFKVTPSCDTRLRQQVMPFTEEAKSAQRGNVEFAFGFKMESEAPKDFLMAPPGL